MRSSEEGECLLLPRIIYFPMRPRDAGFETWGSSVISTSSQATYVPATRHSPSAAAAASSLLN